MLTNEIVGLVLDVDGVLTDGKIYYSETGEALKVFHVQDGSAIQEWQLAGGKVAFLTGRSSVMVSRRAEELGVSMVRQGVRDKLPVFREICQSWSVTPQQVCYVGDDVADLVPMVACGFAVATANALDVVKQQARMVTQRGGGEGAVREVVDFLMKPKADRKGRT